MQVKELRRDRKQTGETIAEFEAGQLLVRLTGTYGVKETLDDLLYVIACRKLAGKLA